jgi:hypothetical protein
MRALPSLFDYSMRPLADLVALTRRAITSHYDYASLLPSNRSDYSIHFDAASYLPRLLEPILFTSTQMTDL